MQMIPIVLVFLVCVGNGMRHPVPSKTTETAPHAHSFAQVKQKVKGRPGPYAVLGLALAFTPASGFGLNVGSALHQHSMNQLQQQRRLQGQAPIMSMGEQPLMLDRRQVGAALAAAMASSTVLPGQPSLAASGPTLTTLGADVRSLREQVRVKRGGAKAAVITGQETILKPLQEMMLAQAPTANAKIQANLMLGHLSELDFYLKKGNGFNEYKRETTGKIYSGGKIERELEEIEETFEQYVRDSLPVAADLEDFGTNYSYGYSYGKLGSVFQGKFSDPNHPRGYREITIEKGVVTIRGKDEPNDAEWTLTAKLLGGDEMVIDFSSKGGPKNLLAKWSSETNAIEFADGNVWPKN